ncbi:MAG: PAS domain S-box protein [Candidatus Levybacteria bacterium]|nr:PAS domain S-box protein [Candidatus Levybacteria bacterium]
MKKKSPTASTPGNKNKMYKKYIVGGGKMGERIREFNWSKTSLGSVETWPQSLRTAINIVLQSPVPIVMLWGKDGIMLYNNGYSVFAGARHPILLGSKVIEGWPEVAEFNKNILTKGLQGKAISYKNQQMTLYRNNVPEDVWMNLNYSPIIDENGKPAGVLAIVIEITASVRAERALEQTQVQLKEALSVGLIGAWTLDIQTNQVTASQSLAVLFGIDPKKAEQGLLSLDVFVDAMHPDDRERVTKIIGHAIKTGKQYEVDYRVIGADKKERWVLARGKNEKPKTGMPHRFTGVLVDITERKMAEEALSENESQLRFMADSMPQQVWTAAPDGALDYINQYAVTYFDKSPKHIIGAGWQKMVHPDDLKESIPIWIDSIKTGKPYQVFFRLRRSDGMYRWHLGRALPLIDEKKVMKWFGTNTDIHDQKELERQKDDFLGIASHELKTPVTSIKAYGQALEAKFRRNGDEKAADLLKKMDAQVNKLSNLIGDLLDVTKFQSGKMQFQEDYFDFNAMVDEVVEEIQRTSESHHIVKKFAQTKRIFGDKERIGQVVINLITNAIKYSPHADAVYVRTTTIGENIVLSVQDAGVGIPKGKQAKVFDQFFRVSGPKESTFPGLGLGLYISSEIIKREGGKIWVESDTGKGSTFSFSLPLKK